MYPNMNNFGQMGNNMNLDLNKMEIINHLTNQNMIMQEQIQLNNILIQKLMDESQPQHSQNIGEFIHIIFKASSGLTTVISTRKDIQVNALLRVYMIRIGLENQLFDNHIIFLHNSSMLNKNDTREINHPQIDIKNNSTIVVNDVNCIIGRQI